MVVKNCMLVGEGGLSKNFGHHGWSARKDFKITLIKTSSNSPKNWTRKSVIQNLIFGLYFLILDFLAESIKANKKLATNVSHFTIPFPSKNLNSLNVVKKKYSHNKAKNLSHFSNF